MRLFSEEVKTTSSNSPLNIIQVANFQEIFFGVLEIEINEKKYPVEKISEHNGDPVVSVPVEMGGKIANYPFVLTKGKFEVIFNEQSDYVDIFESKMEELPMEEAMSNAYSHAKKIIQRGEEISKQNKFLNCEFFCNQMVGGSGFKNNFDSQDVEIFDADQASNLLQTGDIIGFGGGEGQPPRHYAVYIIDGDVYEVEEVGASPRVSTVSDNLDTYEVISKIYRSKADPDSIIYQDSVEIEDLDNRKNDILLQIQEAKKNALIAAKKELELKKSRQIKQIREESETKKKALERYLESARENLVDEFTIISQRIKKEVFDNNDEKYSEIRETIDNKIEEIRDSLDESLKKDFSKSSQLIDKSIKQLVKDLYEKNINPRVDKELRDIAVEIHEKVSEIGKNLDSKLDEKADRSLLEGVDKEISAIRDANIELNNSLNKGVQKALSRVGNVDKKVIQISEEFERKLEEKEQEVVNYFDDKLALVKEETLDITDEARKYFQNLIQESRDGLLTEIRKIKAEKPVEYILETKKSGKIVKDWDSIEKEWNTKIHDKIENVKTDLRKYVTVYASGGGTNATQYQDGGTMNGDLTVVGAISANQYLGLSYLLNDYLSLSGGIVTGDVTITGSISANQYLGLSSGPTGPQGPPGDGVAGNNDVGVIYLKNNTIATSISATNARSVVAGTLSSGAMLNFEKDATTNSLKYTGLSAGRFHVVATFNFYSAANKTCGFYIGKNTNPSSPLDPNGDRISESEIYADAISQTKPSAAAIQTIVDLNPNDRIFFIVQNKESSADITVEFLKFIATSLTAEKGDAGPNSVTNITTSNGTASLSVSSLSADRIYTTQLDALSANISVIDIKQYELSGFNVQGDCTIQGNVSVSGNISATNLSGTNTGDQDLSGLVPYTGATADVNLGSRALSAGDISAAGSVSCNSATIPTFNGNSSFSNNLDVFGDLSGVDIYLNNELRFTPTSPQNITQRIYSDPSDQLVLGITSAGKRVYIGSSSLTYALGSNFYVDRLSIGTTAVDEKLNISGNITASGTISGSNLVYTSSNQTIDGVKNFSSTPTISGNAVATVVDPVRTTLTGDGVLSAFAINGAGSLSNPSALIVAIDGAAQSPSEDYTVNNGVITFTSPLANGAKAVVISPLNVLQIGQMIPSDGSVTSNKLDTNININGNFSAGGDIEATLNTKGVVIRSPNNSRWRITISNSGTLSATAL